MTAAPHWLLEVFGGYGDRPAMIWRDQTVSYSQLLAAINRWTGELQKLAISAGASVAFQGDYSISTCALFLALVANRNIAVPLTPSVGGKRDAYLDIARAEAVFDFDFDEADAWTFSSRDVSLEPHPLLEQLRANSRPGLILFSSGSTGGSKAILHDFDRCLSNIRTHKRSWRAIVFLLLDHIGGVNSLMSILRTGGVVIAVEDRSPAAICSTIERHRAQLLPTSPTFLKMILASGLNEKHDLSSLELVTYGTEAMPPSTLRALNEALPDVTFKQTYGSSELGILPTKSRDSGSLWMKIGGETAELKVQNGTLWIRTRSSMLGYLNAPSPFDEQGWFNTEDAVEVDGEYIRILGRASDIINVGGEKVYPAEVESVLLEMDNIRDVTVAGRRNPVTGQVVSAVVALNEPESPESVKRRIWGHCQGRLTRSQMPMIVEVAEQLGSSERYKKLRRPPGSAEGDGPA